MLKNLSTGTEMKKLSYADLSSFCEQFALILSSGITALEGFYLLRDESTQAEARALFETVIEELEGGISLSEAMELTRVFPAYMLHMVYIGEISGRSESIFRSLAVYYQREDELRKSIRHAIGYPLAMVAILLVIVGVLMVEVIPVFDSVLNQLGGQITDFPKALLDMGTIISQASILLIILLAVVAVALALLFLTARGRELFDYLKQNSFLTKKMVKKIAVSRFSNGMALMLGSGLDADECLSTMETLVENESLKEKISSIRQDIEAGRTFAEALSDSKIFSGVYARMLAVGFKTGSVDSVMKNISQRYDEEVTTRLEGIVSIIEPTIVAVLSIIIGAILLSVMLPLMDIISHMG